MLDGMDGLVMEELVLVSEELEPYVLEAQPGSDIDGVVECYVLVVMRGAEGVLLATPLDAIPQELLDAGNQEGSDGIFGPSTMITVPGVVQDNGTIAPTGEDLQVRLIDCGRGVASLLQHPAIGEEVLYGFDKDQPYALPNPDALLSEASKWVTSAAGLPSFYTAESTAVTPQGTSTAKERSQKAWRRRGYSFRKECFKAKEDDDGSSCKFSGIPHHGHSSVDRSAPGSGGPTESNRGASVGSPFATTSSTCQTSGGSFLNPSEAKLGGSCKSYVASSKDFEAAGIGTSSSAGLKTRSRLGAGEGKGHSRNHRSVKFSKSCQSQALTTLVSQIAAAGQDPMADLTGASSSTSTRGAQGRARLQAELARHQGTFFLSVLQQMARRMAPTSVAEVTPAELVERGITGTRYLERFGGYGRMKEWGQLQYQVMTALDYLMQDNIPAAKDTVALLA